MRKKSEEATVFSTKAQQSCENKQSSRAKLLNLLRVARQYNNGWSLNWESWKKQLLWSCQAVNGESNKGNYKLKDEAIKQRGPSSIKIIVFTGVHGNVWLRWGSKAKRAKSEHFTQKIKC